MKNLKQSTRIILSLALAFCLIGMMVIWNKLHTPAQNNAEQTEALSAPENGSIAVKVDGVGFSPFDIIVIKAGGLDPAAATSIIFTTHNGEVLTIPALEVTTSTIVVPVPPVSYNKSLGLYTTDQATIKAVQITKVGKKLTVKSSNQSNAFMIFFPSLPGAFSKADGKQIPKGAITRLIVFASIESLKSAAAKVPADDKKLSASITKTKNGMEQLLAGIETIIKNPKATVKLKMTNYTTQTIGADDIARLDAFYAGYLGMLEQNELLAQDDKTNNFIPTANAETQNECVANLLKDDLRIKQLDGVAIKLCNTIEPEPSATPQPEKNRYFKWEYFFQTPLLLALGLPEGAVKWNAEVAKWSTTKQIGIATALSMGFSYAYEKKLPDWWSLGSLAATVYAAKYNPFLADLQFATDMWDNLCSLFPKSGCLDTRTIIISSAQIFWDISKHPENLLYLGRAMINGVMSPFADAVSIPDYSTNIALDNTEKNNDGYDEVDVSPAPISPEPIKVIPSPSPSPSPQPSPTPKTPTCAQTKASTLASCNAGCEGEKDTLATYNACTAGCEGSGDLLKKSDCINACISAWLKGISDKSKCLSACSDADRAAQCQ